MFEQLSQTDILVSIVVGVGLCFVYMYLLWKTVTSLPNVEHKKLWLFGSVAARLAVFLIIAATMAYGSASRFFLIVISFLITRLFILKFVKISIRSTLEKRKKKSK